MTQEGIFPGNVPISILTTVPVLSLNSVQCDHMHLFTACLLHKVGINATLFYVLLLPGGEILICPL
jgi:hypothetical protein